MLTWLVMYLLACRSPIPAVADRSACAAFWGWFVPNDERYLQAMIEWERAPPGTVGPESLSWAINEVNDHLRPIHPELSVNFGPLGEDGRRELVVTVEGRREVMPFADALVASAPPLDGWKLVQYKPAIGGPELVVGYNGAQLAAKDVEAAAELVDGQIRVMLFVPGLTAVRPSPDLQGAAVILLDAMVGERRSLTKIDGLTAVPFNQEPGNGVHRFPLAELPARLDALRPTPDDEPTVPARSAGPGAADPPAEDR